MVLATLQYVCMCVISIKITLCKTNRFWQTEQQKMWAKQWEEYYARMGYQQPQGGQPAPPQ